MAVVHTPLMRSSADRKIGGVAAGVAQHFGWDVTLVRIVWAVLALTTGAALILYVILWIALPTDDATPPATGAVRIAEERFARGEITKEELDRLREDLTQ